MPTGYTSIIEDKEDVTLREYALRCARAFGACVHQRDEDIAVPPEPDTSSSTYAKGLRKAKCKLAEVSAWTEDRWRENWETAVADIKLQNEINAREHNAKRARYKKMRVQVEKWEPPMPNHAGLKKFMLSQIDLCYEPNEKPYKQPYCKSLKAFKQRVLDNIVWDIEYYTKKLAEETEALAQSNKWIEDLYASLDKQG